MYDFGTGSTMQISDTPCELTVTSLTTCSFLFLFLFSSTLSETITDFEVKPKAPGWQDNLSALDLCLHLNFCLCWRYLMWTFLAASCTLTLFSFLNTYIKLAPGSSPHFSNIFALLAAPVSKTPMVSHTAILTRHTPQSCSGNTLTKASH